MFVLLLHLRNDSSELIDWNQSLAQRIVVGEVITNSESIHLDNRLDLLEQNIRIDRSISVSRAMVTEIMHLDRRPIRLRVDVGVANEIHVSHVALILRSIHPHDC